MTTMEYRVVTISGEVHRITVVWSDAHEAWTDPGDHGTSEAPTLVVMAEALRRGLLVREIVQPDGATCAETVAAEREACAALCEESSADLKRRYPGEDAADVELNRHAASVLDEMAEDIRRRSR